MAAVELLLVDEVVFGDDDALPTEEATLQDVEPVRQGGLQREKDFKGGDHGAVEGDLAQQTRVHRRRRLTIRAVVGMTTTTPTGHH